jgi:poly-gamma-glutamate synthesis protein (capsule biosynthesis protein)
MKKYKIAIIIAALITLVFVTWYFSAIKKAPNNELSFAFAGDAMFGRSVGYKFQKNNFLDLFSNFDNSILTDKDIAWLNLEGPISAEAVKQSTEDNNLVFNFSRETIKALKYLKITIVGLANNHTANQGPAALEKTKEILKGAGITAVGDPDKINRDGVKYYKKGEITTALIAVNALYGIKGVEELIKEEKAKNNFVIVLPHWGREYEITHSAAQEKLARAWFAAGADLIIGGHPHVVQDAEVINGKLVIYSLGNFIFDQMFSVETQEGLILSGTISANKLKIVLTPIVSKKMKPEIMLGEEREKIINRICLSLGEYCKNGEIEIY